jgi:hypothetical protein
MKIADVQSANSESENPKAKAMYYECSAFDCVSHLQHLKSMQKFHFYFRTVMSHAGGCDTVQQFVVMLEVTEIG